MINSLSIDDLMHIESSNECPIDVDQENVLVERARRGAQRVLAKHDIQWSIGEPSHYQDGALLTQLSMIDRGRGTSVLFSKFGELFTVVRNWDAGSNVARECRCSLLRVFESDYGFRFVHPLVLCRKYDGPFTRYRIGRWYQRLFCEVYSRSGRDHEAVPRWP